MKSEDCPSQNNSRYCAIEKRWRIPGDRCLACAHECAITHDRAQIPEMMTCDWCGKEFPADARACVEAGFDTLHVPEAIMGEEWKGAHAAAVDPESIPPEKRDEMKAAMGLDDAQLIELLTTGEVRGLGAIVCIECQDSGEVDDQ